MSISTRLFRRRSSTPVVAAGQGSAERGFAVRVSDSPGVAAALASLETVNPQRQVPRVSQRAPVSAASVQKVNQGGNSMQVSTAALRKRLGLSPTATEAQIRAALAPVAPVGPRPAVRPERPRLTAGQIQAMTGSQLEVALREVGLTEKERNDLTEALGHQHFMARSFPVEARRLGYPDRPMDLTVRHDGPQIGIAGGG